MSWLQTEFVGHLPTLRQVVPWGVKPSTQTQVAVSLTIFNTEFYGQTILVQALVVSSHLKPVSQRHCVLSLFGDAFNGHYWQVLLIEIDFVLQTQVLLSKT